MRAVIVVVKPFTPLMFGDFGNGFGLYAAAFVTGVYLLAFLEVRCFFGYYTCIVSTILSFACSTTAIS